MLLDDVLTSLKDYGAELGADPEVTSDAAVRRRLPLFLSQIYDPARATIFGRHMLLFVIKRENPTPAEFEKHAQLLAKQFGPDIAFVSSGLPSFDRNRLLKRRIPFIVPHRQMFLPGMMMDLRERHGAKVHHAPNAPLSMPAQLVLLYHLQKRGGDAPFALHAWASTLRYSKMSISRAQKELVGSGLAESTETGREVTLKFMADRQALWEKASPLLRSPVRKEDYYRVKEVLAGSLLNAGLTALATYTDLADAPQPCLAASHLLLKSEPGIEPQPYRDEGTVLIQSWFYPPAVMTEDNQTVDRLSLYLSLRGSSDERVEAALAQLLEGVKW